jgi:hypothetical protein
MNTNKDDSLSGENNSYTRAQAVKDGFLVNVSKTAKKAGIRFPVYLTRAVYDQFVTVPPGVHGQDKTGRLWDILWALRAAILRSGAGCNRLTVELNVRNDNRASRLVELIATCGPLDRNNPRPAISVMLSNEDLGNE